MKGILKIIFGLIVFFIAKYYSEEIGDIIYLGLIFISGLSFGSGLRNIFD